MKAIYPGSFDPITNGHVDIIKKAYRVFDELIVLVATNPKKSYLFTADERVEMIKDLQREGEIPTTDSVEISRFDGLVVDAAEAFGAKAIVRGFRALADFEYEFQMAHVNKRLNNRIETVMFPTSEETTFYSSSMAKELASLGVSLVNIVPGCVEAPLRAKFKKK